MYTTQFHFMMAGKIGELVTRITPVKPHHEDTVCLRKKPHSGIGMPVARNNVDVPNGNTSARFFHAWWKPMLKG